VCVASATIEPRPFLDFFQLPRTVHALKVEGRNFKITDEYIPAPEDLVFSPQLVLFVVTFRIRISLEIDVGLS
jgi:hypothetical protein